MTHLLRYEDIDVAEQRSACNLLMSLNAKTRNSMFHLNLNGASNLEEEQIAKSIQVAESRLVVSMSVSEQYKANSRRILAENWLKTWYVAETLAKHASEHSCEYREGEDGAGNFLFNFVVKDIKGMAKDLVEFAEAFDPDNLEAGAFIYSYAYDWLEKRGNAESRFPDIESDYRNDAEEAEEHRDTDEDE